MSQPPDVHDAPVAELVPELDQLAVDARADWKVPGVKGGVEASNRRRPKQLRHFNVRHGRLSRGVWSLQRSGLVPHDTQQCTDIAKPPAKPEKKGK
jgi:hypothetical protein